MRIGELADRVGVTTDTVRFYEREGWLPRPSRQANGYREYADADVEHLRLLIDLRRLELPLDEAAQVAWWCHSGHCVDTSAQLPRLIADRRTDVADRISRLRDLDVRLADLERHVTASPNPAATGAAPAKRSLAVLAAGGPCCDAAAAVTGIAEGGCACCVPPA